MLLSLGLLCASCAPHGGSSDECGPTVPVPKVLLVSFNGEPYKPPQVTDYPVHRAAGTNMELFLDLNVLRQQDWCHRDYQGPLTFSLADLPPSVAFSFLPNPSPFDLSYSTQTSRLRVSIPSIVPDGPIPIVIRAQESRLEVPTIRIVLATDAP